MTGLKPRVAASRVARPFSDCNGATCAAVAEAAGLAVNAATLADGINGVCIIRPGGKPKNGFGIVVPGINSLCISCPGGKPKNGFGIVAAGINGVCIDCPGGMSPKALSNRLTTPSIEPAITFEGCNNEALAASAPT